MVVGITPLATLEVDVSDWPLGQVTLNVLCYRGLPTNHEQCSKSIAWKMFNFPTYDAISVITLGKASYLLPNFHFG